MEQYVVRLSLDVEGAAEKVLQLMCHWSQHTTYLKNLCFNEKNHFLKTADRSKKLTIFMFLNVLFTFLATALFKLIFVLHKDALFRYEIIIFWQYRLLDSCADN